MLCYYLRFVEQFYDLYIIGKKTDRGDWRSDVSHIVSGRGTIKA